MIFDGLEITFAKTKDVDRAFANGVRNAVPQWNTIFQRLI